MSDIISKWNQMEEDRIEERNKIIGQNGTTGEHYGVTTTDSVWVNKEDLWVTTNPAWINKDSMIVDNSRIKKLENVLNSMTEEQFERFISFLSI
jgi:uncharacterized protein YlxW (UPF0749 family)